MLRDDRTTSLDARRAEAEALALAYSAAHRGDDRAALIAAITDALVDLDTAEEKTAAARRAVSHGFVRARIGRS
ncbi:MAG: hypothetical protein ACAH20_12275 [Methylobacteriaceae bacterium]